MLLANSRLCDFLKLNCTMGGPSVSNVRALAMYADGAAGPQAYVRCMLLVAVRAGAGEHTPLPPAAASATLTSSCALVATRHSAPTGGAHRTPLNLNIGEPRGLRPCPARVTLQ